MNEKKAIVLGGTAPHAMLINKLKKRGYYVILVDYLKESPGKRLQINIYVKVPWI